MKRAAGYTALGAIFGLLIMVVALKGGGGAPVESPPGIPDPGLFIGWSLPAFKLATQLASVGAIGFLVAAVFLLPSSKDTVEGLASRSVQLASRWAVAWSVSSLLLFIVSVGDTFAQPLSGLNTTFVSAFAFETSQGRAILIQAVSAALIAAVGRWTLNIRTLAVLLGFAVVTLLPIALTGHATTTGTHDLATVSLFLHLIGVTFWVGGLAALGWVAMRGSKRFEAAVRRYSGLALWMCLIVGASGFANALARLEKISEFWDSDYGVLVLGKTLFLVVLMGFGWMHRKRIIAAGGGFVRLAIGELITMAGAIGLAVALSRTPPPGAAKMRSVAENLLGGPMPPAPSVRHYLLGFQPSGVGLAIVGLASALYIAGIVVLRRNGVTWPVGRVVAWFGGLAIVSWSTFGGLGMYSHVLFSAHMVQHMLLSMVAPILLILGAPMTLALRSLPGPRQPGEVSPRSLLTSLLHSRFARFMTHPLVGPLIFTGSLYGLYFTPMFELLMKSQWGHGAMELHFLLAGVLYYYVIIGIDPSPRSMQPLLRFGILMVTVPFHAFFAIAVMSAKTVLASGYWQLIDRPYKTDLMTDQYLGGGIAWAMGELPILLVMLALFAQWIRIDLREARRYDRNEKRTADHQLEEYNNYLRELAEQGKRREP